MSMKIENLKKHGQRADVSKNTNMQARVLRVVKAAHKRSEAVTQKEVAAELSKQLKRAVQPQQARTCLLALVKKEKVVRRVVTPPDESGNHVFFYLRT